MRAFVSGWTGRRLNDSNMTLSGENYATAVIDLFKRANTLSEFNSGTYTGVSLYALTLWAKYLPEDSVMKQNGAKMIQYTWEAVAELWHPQLKNVAGPWDRSYGFDMNRYLSLLALHLWNVIGKEKSSILSKVAFPFPSTKLYNAYQNRQQQCPTSRTGRTARNSPSSQNSTPPSFLRPWLRSSTTFKGNTPLPLPLSHLRLISTRVTLPHGWRQISASAQRLLMKQRLVDRR
jgi:hypothetical protein